MKRSLLVCLASVILSACAQQPAVKIPAGSTHPGPNEAVATFAEGCFWHSEIVFQSLKGVRDAVSGYAGGSVKNPDYETVCTGITGHAESVQVFYDTTVVSFKTLVDAFLPVWTPPSLTGRVMMPVRSIVLLHSTEQKERGGLLKLPLKN